MENEFFLPINEVSKRLSLPAHTLRYWEKQFPTIIRPTTGSGGRRYYRTEMVARLEIIRDLLYNRGMTIAGVKKIIHDGDFPQTLENVHDVLPVVPPVAEQVDFTPHVKNESATSDALKNAQIDVALDLLNQAKDLLKP